MAPQQVTARADYISWDDYFMSVALLTAMRSKDPKTQVGACIVNPENRIVGVGYNGFPTGICDSKLPWSKESPEGELETKYPYVVHAELNAVLNSNQSSCAGCRIFCSLFPCNECAKVIIQVGIREVVYARDRLKTSSQASRRMFQLAGIKLREHVPCKRALAIPCNDVVYGGQPESTSSTEDVPEALRTSSRQRQEQGTPLCGRCGCCFLGEVPFEILREGVEAWPRRWLLLLVPVALGGAAALLSGVARARAAAH